MIMCKEKYAKAVDRAVFPGMQGGPHDHINLAKAVALGEALKPGFKKYAEQVIKNCQKLAVELIKLDYKIISGGTDNHLVVVDLTNKQLNGREAEQILELVGISVSRSTIPNDPNPPTKPSGVRLGTATLTTRGMKEKEVIMIAKWIELALINRDNGKKLVALKKEVKELCHKFPMPGIKNN
jgi:glycine hydroxymethyltransferase